MTLPPVKAP